MNFDYSNQIENARPKLQIIIASTRPGRRGLPIGEWVRDRAVEQGKFDVEVADLAEINLPFMDEPNHPRTRQYTKQHTKDWSARIESSSAFIIVTPEYNFGMNAPLKNAIDYLAQEWQYKPVGFVSYGGVSGGTRAVQMIKQVVTTLKMMPISEAVTISFHAQYFNDEGKFLPNASLNDALTTMLNELAKVEGALRPLRTPVQEPEPAQPVLASAAR